MDFIELTKKQVINERDCRVLGYVCNLRFDECSGVITELIVPGPERYMKLFCRENDYVIPYKCVCNIGEDIILVDVDLKECLKKCETNKWHDSFF